MDIVAIERVSFDSFRKKLEQIISLADNTSLSSSDMCIEKEWIEGKTLAASLNISLRTLQSLRESGKLSFSAVGKKVYYKVAEVQKLLDSGRIKVTIKEQLLVDLYTNEDSQELLQSLDRALPYIEYALKNNKPMFEGEQYLTSEELCSILKISRRTLQYYRDDGIFPFIQLPGKVLFRESDIKKVLEDRFRSAYNIGDYSL